MYSEQVVDDCYHEAAHAVFWHRAGIEILELRVDGEGKILSEWPTDPSPAQALDLAAGCLAGPLSVSVMRGQGLQPMAFDDFVRTADFAAATAELMGQAGIAVDPEHLRAIRPDDFGDDYEDTLSMLQIAQPECGELESCYEAAVERVRRGLDEWWAEIQAVAEALMEARLLSGTQAVRVMESAGSSGSARE